MEAKYEWIHDLVDHERVIEETGVVNYGTDLDPERVMIGSALTFLHNLKLTMKEMIEEFNSFKRDKQGQIKLYNIAKTPADFMIFRNGLKLAFSLKQPGVISVRAHFMNPAIPVSSMVSLQSQNLSAEPLLASQYRGSEDLIEFMWGPFNEALWTYRGQVVKIENVAQFYLTKFVRESIRPGA